MAGSLRTQNKSLISYLIHLCVFDTGYLSTLATWVTQLITAALKFFNLFLSSFEVEDEYHFTNCHPIARENV